MEFIGIGMVYLAFAAIVCIGMIYDWPWVVFAGIVMFFVYSAKAELEIIRSRSVVQQNCIVNNGAPTEGGKHE